jgi:hypothetical protein
MVHRNMQTTTHAETGTLEGLYTRIVHQSFAALRLH